MQGFIFFFKGVRSFLRAVVTTGGKENNPPLKYNFGFYSYSFTGLRNLCGFFNLLRINVHILKCQRH